MFDRDQLSRAIAAHGPVARVAIARVHGSAPREVGASMLVWSDGQSGTIGGGALEYELTKRARAQKAPARLSRHALGPDMGQCCGGAVEVVTELYTAEDCARLDHDLICRSVEDAGDMPLSVRRILAKLRNEGICPTAQLIDGWFIEPVARPTRQIWIWGAGHVGRALVSVLSGLPDVAMTWVDMAADRFPPSLPDGCTAVPAVDPVTLVRHAPLAADHLILTYSHELDLGLCHALLSHDFASAGLIGSRSKWARFRRRLQDLGHSPNQIARIDCPIGDPSLGKHPQAIAVGVAAAMLRDERHQLRRETHA